MSYTPHTEQEIKQMLNAVGKESLDDLFESVPKEIYKTHEMNLPKSYSENELKKFFRKLASENKVFESNFLGGGCYNHYIPSAVSTITSDSRFFTAYTPYQAEASQGTLQAIYEYQTYMSRLTGMDVSNASLYDGATAICEASIISIAETKRKKVMISEALHPEYAETLASYIGSENIIKVPFDEKGLTDYEVLKSKLTNEIACVILQNPNFLGSIENPNKIAEAVKQNKSLLVIAINEPYSLGVIKNPRDCGADIAVGDAQSFGCSMGFGGPSLGFLTVKRNLMRKISGRLAGKTVDTDGQEGFVLTLQAREQHIRREKASSNICSNEALCALSATVHLSLIGKSGFMQTAENNLEKAHYMAKKISELDGFSLKFKSSFFNEFVVNCSKETPKQIVERMASKNIGGGIPLGRFYPNMKDCLLIAVTEMNTKEDIDNFVKELSEGAKK